MDSDEECAKAIIEIARKFNVGAGGALMNSIIWKQMPNRDKRERGIAFALENDWLQLNGGPSYLVTAKGVAGLL